MITEAAIASAFARWLGDPGVVLETFATVSGAMICLGPSRAIKVQSPALDHKARCAAVDRELYLAHRLQPDRRVALARLWYQEGELSDRAEDGEPVVLMRRLDPIPVRYLCSERLYEVAQDFAMLLAAFHSASPVQSLTKDELDEYLRREEHLTDWAREHLPKTPLPSTIIERLGSIAERLDSSRPEATNRIHARARKGFRRDGHGDLHVENLFLLNGGATLFDPLPFDHLRIDDVSADTGRLAREFERILDRSLGEAIIGAYGSAGGSADNFLVAREMLRADLYELRAQLEEQAGGCRPAERWEFFVRSLNKTSTGEQLLDTEEDGY